MGNFLKELFIDDVKGCLRSDCDGSGTLPPQYDSDSVATEEEVSDVINSVFNERMV